MFADWLNKQYCLRNDIGYGTEIVIVNNSGKNTYEPDVVVQSVTLIDKNAEQILATPLRPPHSTLLRNGNYQKVVINLIQKI